MNRHDVTVFQRPLGLRLLSSIERDLEDDLPSPQGEVAGQEDAGRAALAQQRQKLEFLERVTRLGKWRRLVPHPGGLADQAMILELREQRVLPLRIAIAERLDVDPIAALFAKAELLVDDAQDPALGTPQFRESIEVSGHRRGLPPRISACKSVLISSDSSAIGSSSSTTR